MKKSIKLTALLCIIVSLVLLAASCSIVNTDGDERPVDPESDPRYDLIFFDDFNIFNPNVWVTDTGPRRGGYWHSDQVFVENGNLTIRTSYENGEFGSAYYTGCVSTDLLSGIPYGRYEIRFKTEHAPGYWSAIWLMQNGLGSNGNGARDGAEIDLMEIYGDDMYQHRIHIDSYGESNGYTIINNNLKDVWHKLVMEWTESRITFYMDNVKTWEVTDDYWISRVNEGTFVISCEINGEIVDGVPDPSKNAWIGVGNITGNGTDFSQDMLIDYVKVYRINEQA